MNPRLKLALIRHTGEQGFASVIAVGVGLVMMIIGLTMALRSQSDVALSSTQRSTSRALSAAEVGVTRYQYLLNTVRVLAMAEYPINTLTNTWLWSNPTAISGYSSSPCSGTTSYILTNTITSTYATTGWQNADNNTQYRLVSYTYTPNPSPPNNPALANDLLGTGTLTIQGRTRVSNTINTPSTSTAQLQVKIPIKKTNPITIPTPGVWVNSAAVGNNAVQGDVFLNDCNVDLSTVPIVQGTNTNYQARYITNDLPNIPTMPAYYVSGNTGGTYDLNNVTTGRVGLDLNTATSTGNNTLTLPRGGDKTVPIFNPITRITENWNVYAVTDIYTSSAKATIKIANNAKVRIYVSGNFNDPNISVDRGCGGSAGAGCTPADLQIYGTGPVGSEICLNGTNYIEAFILAPNYSVGVQGTGGGKGGYKGAVWTKQWSNSSGCGSNTQNTAVVQMADWSSIGLSPKNLPPYIDAPNSWTKQAVQ